MQVMTLIVEFDDEAQLPELLEQFARRTRNYGLADRHETYTAPNGMRVAVMRHRALPSTSRAGSASPRPETD